jgi:hypothetical protein
MEPKHDDVIHRLSLFGRTILIVAMSPGTGLSGSFSLLPPFIRKPPHTVHRHEIISIESFGHLLL